MTKLMKDLTQLEKQQNNNLMGMEGAEDLFGELGAEGGEYGDEMQMIQKLLSGLTQQT